MVKALAGSGFRCGILLGEDDADDGDLVTAAIASQAGWGPQQLPLCLLSKPDDGSGVGTPGVVSGAETSAADADTDASRLSH